MVMNSDTKQMRRALVENTEKKSDVSIVINTIWWLFTKLALIIDQCPAHFYIDIDMRFIFTDQQTFDYIFPFIRYVETKLFLKIYPQNMQISTFEFFLLNLNCEWVTVCCTRNACQLIAH